MPHVKLASLQSRPQALKLEKTIKNICGGKKEERKSITSYNFTIMVGQYLSDESIYYSDIINYNLSYITLVKNYGIKDVEC